MFSILTRTSNRPRYFAQCRESVLAQTMPAYHIIGTDTRADTYPVGDALVHLDAAPGRGHNLYFNTMRHYVPPAYPWVIALDDDDQFCGPYSLWQIAQAIDVYWPDTDLLILWRVRFADGRILPERELFGYPPQFGHITGIGFCIHIQNWHDWQGIPGGDFQVISHHYKTLKAVWINEILTTCCQVGGGKRIDKL